MSEYGPDTSDINSKFRKDENDRIRKAAENEWFKFIARACMVVLTLVGLPIATYIGSRLVSSLDSARYDINEIKLSMRGFQGDLVRLGDRIDNVERNTNERITAISGWARQNAESIDRLRERLFFQGDKK